jgi:integrase/recombinase XerD
MATRLFRSPLAFRLQAFLETRRAAGRNDAGSQKIIRYMDRFLMSELKPGEPITRGIVERWFKSMEHLSPATRINRFPILRQFCLYLSHFDPRTCIIHRSFVPHKTRPVPHIYTREEVRQIMATSRRIGPAQGSRPLVLSTLVGLLYTTGLRVGEALKLTIGEVDLKRRLIHVRESKFKKSRYVPISPSTADQLAAYLRQLRKAGYPASPNSPFFVAPGGSRYGKSAFARTFLEIVRKTGIRGPKGQRGPRVHDFRHTFAVNRLLAWHRQGPYLLAKLPLLSTYFGHTTVTHTEVYLHATAELLESVGKRFHAHFAIPARIKKERHGKN